MPDARPRVWKRRFRTALVEAEMERLAGKIADPALRRIWMNSHPNTLDTTVAWTDLQPDEADHTKSFSHHRRHRGELAARFNLAAPAALASPFCTSPSHAVADDEWRKLYRFALGLIYMQSQLVITDPFVNTFSPPPSACATRQPTSLIPTQTGARRPSYLRKGTTTRGRTLQRRQYDGVYIRESKWEVDSLASVLALPHALYNASSRRDVARNRTWQRAVRLAMYTLRWQQHSTAEEHLQQPASAASLPDRGEWQARFGSRSGGGVYRFQRAARTATETQRRRLRRAGQADRHGEERLLTVGRCDRLSLPGACERLPCRRADRGARRHRGDGRRQSRRSAMRSKSPPSSASERCRACTTRERSSHSKSTATARARSWTTRTSRLCSHCRTWASSAQMIRCTDARGAQLCVEWAKLGSGIGGPHAGWGHAWPMSRSVQILTTTRSPGFPAQHDDWHRAHPRERQSERLYAGCGSAGHAGNLDRHFSTLSRRILRSDLMYSQRAMYDAVRLARMLSPA